MAFLALLFPLWIIKLAVALFVAFTKEVPTANIFFQLLKDMFYKVIFCRDFLDFFALALVGFTHISGCSVPWLQRSVLKIPNVK